MKRRNEMKIKETSMTQTIIDHLNDLEESTFTIKQVHEAFPLMNPNTISTIISRDLKKKGLVFKTNKRIGMNLVYSLVPIKEEKQIPLELESKPKPILSPALKGKKSRPAPNSIKKIEPDSYDSYVKIGKAIEQLLEDKNNTIYELEIKYAGLKKNLIDSQATVQERDRHIVEQGNKIYELSEKIRNKSGGSIKLDELQSIING